MAKKDVSGNRLPFAMFAKPASYWPSSKYTIPPPQELVALAGAFGGRVALYIEAHGFDDYRQVRIAHDDWAGHEFYAASVSHDYPLEMLIPYAPERMANDPLVRAAHIELSEQGIGAA